METLETYQEMAILEKLLKKAKRFKCRTEVMYWALKSMKQNPEQSIISALEDGINEWIK